MAVECRELWTRYTTKAALMKLHEFLTSTFFLAGVLGSAGAATLAQTTAPAPSTQATYTDQLATTDSSQPGFSESEAPLGPALPEQIKLTGSLIPPNPLTDWASAHRLRFFGWANGGYTESSTGPGLLEVEPRENRFGDAWLLDQSAFVLERTLNEEAWSWGFRSEFYMGADAALLHPVNGFGPDSHASVPISVKRTFPSMHRS